MSNLVLKFSPEVNRRDTDLANEGKYVDSNRVRSWQGKMQSIGGWTLSSAEAIPGTARKIHSWVTKEGIKAEAIGTSSHLLAQVGGIRRDITPNLFDTVLTDPFTTENGSDIVGVKTEGAHRFVEGNVVTFSNHQSTIANLVIDGDYDVTEVISETEFTITHSVAANATVSTPAGGNVDFVAILPSGLSDKPVKGYGVGGFGVDAYSGQLSDEDDIRTWSLDSWGENLVANPSGFPIFEYQAEAIYVDLAFNGDFAIDADGWALGTGWSWGAAKVSKTAGTGSNLSQDIEDVLEGGRYYVATFDIERSAGEIKLRVNAGETPAVIDVGSASAAITKSGSYRRLFLCPADPKDLVFEADATFSGSVDNVTYELYDRAYRITTAPPRVGYIFVDPRGILLALETTLLDGSYSKAAYRCSDLGNNRIWIPDTDNLASEDNLFGAGSQLLSGVATRQQNLIWGDNGVFSLQYNGVAGAAFTYELVGVGCGIMSRNAMAASSGFVLWMGNTGQFYMFEGVGYTDLGEPKPITCPIGKDIFDNLDRLQSMKVHAGINPEFSEFWVFYPDIRDGNECSRVASCSWTQNAGEGNPPWVSHMLARTAWRASGVTEKPLATSAPNSNSDSYLYTHEDGFTANGQALGEYIKSGDFNAGEGTNLFRINTIIPDVKDQGGNLKYTITSKMDPHGEELVWESDLVPGDQTRVYPRILTRQASITISGQTSGEPWRAGEIALDIEPSGAKR